ncbi:MAG TPA: peptidylprolyl isomerase [Steroidobacteraceae bacterium]|nr:peptidylprolyl isomerase [Steroidobacteraceae bacterium]
MKFTAVPAIVLLSALAACAPKSTPAPGADATAKPVATVNGKPLPAAEFTFFSQTVAGKPPGELTPEQRSQLLDTLVRAEVVAQQAEKDGLDKQGDAPQSMAMMRLQVLERAAMANYLKDRKPTDAELKAEYDAQVAAMPKTQYKARHILVKTKEEADAIIAELKKGAKFEKLAADKSLDNSRTNGGDLGWFGPNNMVKPFADAVASLKKGETTSAPVQTEFGWHVIRLDDTRPITPPAFDAAKDKIEQIVEAKKFKAYEDGLLAAAKVDKTP